MPQILRPRISIHRDLLGNDLDIARAFSAAGNPGNAADGNLVPTVIGELFFDTDTDDVWIANGLTVADWIALRHDPIQLVATDIFSSGAGGPAGVVIGSGSGQAMTTTPPAGTYLVLFSGSASGSTASTDAIFTIFAGGAAVAGSERQIGNTNVITPFACVALAVVDGTQAIEGRGFTNGPGTFSIDDRTMIVWRVR